MKDDEIALAVCSHATAQMLMEKEKDPDVIDALVITNVVDDNTVYLIPKQEFLDYLEEKDKKVRE